jgi:TPR repeat protein
MYIYLLQMLIEKLFLDYLEQAAELKDADALFCIADMYYNGTDGNTPEKPPAN